MKKIALLLFSVGALLLQACEPAPRQAASRPSAPAQSENVAAAIADIESMGVRIGAGEIAAARTLPQNINVLTRAIERGGPNAQGAEVLYYYRGVARQTLSGLNRAFGLPADRPMAEAALIDFEFARNAKDADSADIAKNALYLAGQTAFRELDDSVRAMRYFQRCADLKHAGCQGIIASAKITGTDGFRKDIPGAVALHQEAFASGLDYGCAGSYSAYSLTRLTHFSGANADGKTSLEWLRRSVRLADQMKVRASGVDHCAGNFMTIYEYLIRLESGERNNALLEQFDDEDAGIFAEVIGNMLAYLRNGSGEAAYRKSVSDLRDPEARCQFAFVGLWNAAISRQMNAARAYRDLLRQDSSEPSCRENLVFAGKYLR